MRWSAVGGKLTVRNEGAPALEINGAQGGSLLFTSNVAAVWVERLDVDYQEPVITLIAGEER